MMIMDKLEKKQVLILGLGREGMSTFAFLRRHFPFKLMGLADKLSWTQLEEQKRQIIESDGRVALFLGPEYLESILKHDIVFKTPGIPSFIPELVAARQLGKISSNTELFFERCPGIIIGVTGTKGKSTTTSLIYEVLKTGGLDARLIGNIGIPSLASLDGATPETVFVVELSSHQLMDLRKSPHIAVLQNVVPEHLDYYGTFEAYVRAKQTIVQYQEENDYVIFNASHPIPRRIASMSRAKRIPFGLNTTENAGCLLEDESLIFCSDGKRERTMSIQTVPLRGTFNLQNVMPAIVVGKIFGVSNDVIAASIQNFKPLEHRLEFVGLCNGVSFYNDSLATIPEATIAALQTFSRNLILLAGGFDRGQDFAELALTVLTCDVKGIFLFPTTGERLWNEIELQASGRGYLPRHTFVTSMRDAVQGAYSLAKEGDIILLSPASASFGGFRDYRDRGNQFKAEVRKIISGNS